MALDNLKYYEDLFCRIKEKWFSRPEIIAFGKCFHNPVWLVLPMGEEEYKRAAREELTDVIRDHKDADKILFDNMDKLFLCLKKVSRVHVMDIFDYSTDLCGICYPLLSDDRMFGCVVMAGMKRHPSENTQNIFKVFADTVVRETRKEVELEEMNATLRPRIVALSTVHTVHRLMTSTLNLNELLPRIARLSLQVLGANRCSIKLVDKKRKVLIPKTTVDLRKKKAKLKKVQIGQYSPGKAVKKAMSIRGANYLATPLIDGDVVGVITLYDKLDGSEFNSYDEEIMKTLAEQAVTAIKNAQLFHEQELITMNSIKCIAMLLKMRVHGARKAEESFLKIIALIGRKFKMSEIDIKMMQYAEMLHDTGQISIPEEVLMKKGVLTGKEYDIVKTHPLTGANILSKFKPLKPIVPIILYHHENFDGTGYPKKLKGEEIPLGARILGIVSAFEAMVLHKPYRQALSIDSAIQEVKRTAGTQFDPRIVEAFCEVVARKNVRNMLKNELGVRN
ncbi:MAG TPA: HD domain-containing phosphohydrolase [Candidatus Omnitrophota bacterium]|nr:HD domain-containing phosphohydrolase [Candidatus Omnitrophota bacterium]HPS20846.1 HD domain-containing phosphohydrolase [Candidatus Omnitrophota bacterium]